jgi:hypothetical protein
VEGEPGEVQEAQGGEGAVCAGEDEELFPERDKWLKLENEGGVADEAANSGSEDDKRQPRRRRTLRKNEWQWIITSIVFIARVRLLCEGVDGSPSFSGDGPPESTRWSFSLCIKHVRIKRYQT